MEESIINETDTTVVLAFAGKVPPRRDSLCLTKERLKQVLSKVAYYPHKEYHVGTLMVAKKCWISTEATLDLTGNITIGEFSMISAPCRVYTHDHIINGREIVLETQAREGVIWKDKVIGRDVWLNSGVIVLMNCDRIADGVIVAAGSVVTAPIVDEYTIWGGNPARRLKER